MTSATCPSFLVIPQPPGIYDVNSAADDGPKGTGAVIEIIVTFTSRVTLGNETAIAPKLKLNTAPTRHASYVTGSGTSALTFRYTVAAGDSSPRLGTADTGPWIDLGGRTLKDDYGQDAVVGALSSDPTRQLVAHRNIVIDTTPPAELADFQGATGTLARRVNLTLTFPANRSDYKWVKIYRASGGSPGIAAPGTCDGLTGTLAATVTSFDADTLLIADDTGAEGTYNSYRACVTDLAGNHSASPKQKLDVQSKAYSYLAYLDAAVSASRQANSWLSATTSTTVKATTSATSWLGDGTTLSPHRLKLDGVSSYAALDPLLVPVTTYAVWFKVNQTTETRERCVFQRRGAGTKAWVHGSGGLPPGTSQLKMKYAGWELETVPISHNYWHHLVMVNTGPAVATYLDGVFISERAQNVTENNGASYPIILGRDPQAGDCQLDGEVALFQAYSSVIAAADVQALYEDGLKKFTPDPGAISLRRVIPAVLSTAGGETVDVYGWRLGSTASLLFDTTSMAPIYVRTDGKISAVSTPHAAGYFDLSASAGATADTRSGVLRFTDSRTANCSLFLDAANIDGMGNRGAADSPKEWKSLCNGRLASLNGFTSTSGWWGNGTKTVDPNARETTGPYRLHLDGFDDFVLIGNNKARTAALWVYLEDTGAGDVSKLLFSADSFQVRYGKYSGASKFLVSFSGFPTTSFASFPQVATGTTFGSWHLVTSVLNAAGTLSLYVDGVLKATQAIGSNFYSPTTSVQMSHIGVDTSGTFRYVGGDIAVYRSYTDALDASEVKKLWNADCQRFFDSSCAIP